MLTPAAIAPLLESIVGATGVCSFKALDASWKERISQTVTPATEIDCIVYPHTQAELAEVMALAHRHRWGVLPCGSGSKLSWGGLAEADRPYQGGIVVVSTARLDKLIDHAAGDLTVTAEAGMKLSALQEILAKAGQFLALDPAYPEIATLGGIVATADTGSLRQRYGGVRDQLIGISFVRSDGQLAKAGGRVVKNVAGYDLMKLFVGSYGTLGIICQVTFRVYPLPLASRTVMLIGEANAIAIASQTLRQSALTPTAADLLSTGLVEMLAAKSGMGLLVRFQSIPESVEEQSDRVLEVGKTLGLVGTSYSAADESALWQRLQELMSELDPAIVCKIGVRPSEAVGSLSWMDSRLGRGLIHAGSGLGRLWFVGEEAIAPVAKMRSLLAANGGFLTILSAPISVKQHLDVWGYNGNALDLMRKIKGQFDPENVLSRNRFVGGI